MSELDHITNAGALKLQHASAVQLQTRPAPGAAANAGAQKKANVQFADLLQKEQQRSQSVHFSKHAAQRVQERGIEMTDGLLSDLNQAVAKAREKGARDVVVIGENGAFIVNIPHNVVVTTMSGSEMKDNIFTNIDSAVLM